MTVINFPQPKPSDVTGVFSLHEVALLISAVGVAIDSNIELLITWQALPKNARYVAAINRRKAENIELRALRTKLQEL